MDEDVGGAAREAYQAWARSFHGAAFLRRSAERNAAFLLPHLQPGQRVVDIGCGPGAITAGLAERVAPGEVLGLDRDGAYVDEARSRWTAPNLRFAEADAAELPLDDDSVDLAFLHAVLQHVESPADVLREVRRVVRPGGLVAVGDADLDGFLIHPVTDGLTDALELDRRTRRNPDVGRRLPALLVEAGFADVEFSATATSVAGPATEALAGATALRLGAEPFIARATAEGWAQREDLDRMVAAWQRWASAPGAVFVTLWCQALAR